MLLPVLSVQNPRDGNDRKALYLFSAMAVLAAASAAALVTQKALQRRVRDCTVPTQERERERKETLKKNVYFCELF
jgi:hypothetical protein